MIGEPDAGNPQVRFDEGMQETGGNVPRLRPTLRCSVIVVVWPWLFARRCDATRWLLWKISMVVGIERTSTSS
jgi:hypothetical protein